MITEVSYYTTRKNARRVDYPDANVTLWYSYKTIVAIRQNGKLYVSENIWGTTTGKHLNIIDNGDKKNRLSRAEFKAIVEALEVEHD